MFASRRQVFSFLAILASPLLSLYGLEGTSPAKAKVITFDGHPKFKRVTHLSPRAQALLKTEAVDALRGPAVGTAATSTGVSIDSVPHWYSSFLGTDGNLYPYVMVGTKPTHGGTSTIKTPIVPLKVRFQGNPTNPDTGETVVYDAAPILTPFEESPNFVKHHYDSGYTQYGDAGQRATFWKGMKPDWHVLVEHTMKKERTLTVPQGSFLGFYSYDSNGNLKFDFYAIDLAWWEPAILKLMKDGGFSDSEFPILLSKDVYLYEDLGGGQYGCCVLGYHDAYDTHINSDTTKVVVQSYAWASWISPGFFGGGFEDVTGISHEIAEWMNDPFPQPFINYVRPWLYPGTTDVCQNNLEVGDPIEALSYASYAVDGYHPTNLALAQWFMNDGSQKKSSALKAAYSWPDATMLPQAADVCPGY